MESEKSRRRFVRGTPSEDAPNAKSSMSQMYFQLVEDAKYAALVDLGVKEPVQPANELPELPQDIAGVSDTELMSLYVGLTKWAGFFSMQLAIDEVKEDLSTKLVKRTENLFMLTAPGKTATEKKCAMEEDEKILKVREAQEVVYAHKSFIKVFYDNSVRDAAVCSRELSRRIEMETGNRRTD